MKPELILRGTKEEHKLIALNIAKHRCLFYGTNIHTDFGCDHGCFTCIRSRITHEETPRWRAEKGSKYYYYVTSDGYTDYSLDHGSDDCNTQYNSGNYFRTEQEAKDSKFYKVFHGEDE